MTAERIYRLLLRAYPPEFRAEFGREMELAFRDQCRDNDVRTFGFWARVVWDVLRSAPALRAEATRTVEVPMKVAAIFTLLVGLFGIVSEVGEWVAASRQPVAGNYVLSLALGIAATLLLLGAGVAILLGTRKAARLALVASLVCFVAARIAFPWMGIFVQLVGFGFPVALLIALYWPRARGGTASAETRLLL